MTELLWKTGVAGQIDGTTVLRGYPLDELIGNISFPDAIYLVLKGELPSAPESKMMNAMLTACIDHGIAPPSVVAARMGHTELPAVVPERERITAGAVAEHAVSVASFDGSPSFPAKSTAQTLSSITSMVPEPKAPPTLPMPKSMGTSRAAAVTIPAEAPPVWHILNLPPSRMPPP